MGLFGCGAMWARMEGGGEVRNGSGEGVRGARGVQRTGGCARERRVCKAAGSGGAEGGRCECGSGGAVRRTTGVQSTPGVQREKESSVRCSGGVQSSGGVQ